MRRLNSKEISSYRHVPEHTLESVRIIEGIAVPGFAGITLGNFIFLKNKVSTKGDSQLLAHELVHVRQWRELGSIGFLTKYLASFFHHIKQSRSWMTAYRAIELEVEARDGCDRWVKTCTDNPDQR